MVIPLAPCQGNWKRKPDIFIILVDLDGLSAYNSGHIISFIAFAMIEPARPEQRQAAQLPTIDREPGESSNTLSAALVAVEAFGAASHAYL